MRMLMIVLLSKRMIVIPKTMIMMMHLKKIMVVMVMIPTQLMMTVTRLRIMIYLFKNYGFPHYRLTVPKYNLFTQ